jgi:hypothetical protein
MNKKFWKELICLLSLHYLKKVICIKTSVCPNTTLVGNFVPILKLSHIQNKQQKSCRFVMIFYYTKCAKLFNFRHK